MDPKAVTVNLASFRRQEYVSPPLFLKVPNSSLKLKDLVENPLVQFQNWLNEAVENEKAVEPNAMVLATCGSDHQPSARYVLLKEVNNGGLVFYTNYGSRKAQQIEENDKVAAMFYWPSMNRSVRIEGKLSKITAEESDNYFNSRPIKSRIGATLSRQSEVITEEKKREMVRIGSDWVVVEGC
jgi:pyridoxamine 5'-phosphate oxidase